MYAVILVIHNIIRWVVLGTGLFAVGNAIVGRLRNKKWTEAHKRLGLIFTISVYLQILLGTLLYLVFSDWGIKAILNNGISYVMSQAEYRFFSVEHIMVMFLGFLFAHLGSVLPKKIEEPSKKLNRTALWYGLALIMFLAGTPWSRPLFP
jgi:hypothetical protein